MVAHGTRQHGAILLTRKTLRVVLSDFLARSGGGTVFSVTSHAQMIAQAGDRAKEEVLPPLAKIRRQNLDALDVVCELLLQEGRKSEKR